MHNTRHQEHAVTALGMVSSLGLDVVTSCAAARAGIVRAAPYRGFTTYSAADWSEIGVTAHYPREYSDGFEGNGKIVRLGEGAMSDLMKQADLSTQQWSRTGLFINLSSHYYESEHAALGSAEDRQAGIARIADMKVAQRKALLDRISTMTGTRVDPSQQFVCFGDEAGIAQITAKALALLSSGQFDRCIVGGVDAYSDPDLLEAAHHFGLVKLAEQPMGFQPGEAAAFFMLESPSAADAREVIPLAQLRTASYAEDPVRRIGEDPAIGHGLVQTISQAIAALPDNGRQIGWVIGNLNGDAFRANDWGYASVRLIARHPMLRDCPLNMPAESFGEVGAADGAVAVCVAIRAFVRNYAPASEALLWQASDAGGRGALVVSKAK